MATRISTRTPERHPDARSVLRLLTCGSVDDGKSTLIGRLLHDSKAILADAMQALTRTSQRRGQARMDLSLLTDGLQAEREQGITIDVAYRYFATDKRKFILADAPGHEQYTRNMVTAASTADLAVLLVDARKGMLPQTRRHLALVHALGIRHLVVAVNKMDLVAWDRATFLRIRAQVEACAAALGAKELHFIPLSALEGDHVVERSARMPWHAGPTLLNLLESIEVENARQARPFRFPVQGVLRPHQDFRGYTGRIASGRLNEGDEIIALPSMRRARVRAIWFGTERLPAAIAGQSVTLELDGDLDVSRGDLLAAPRGAPTLARSLQAEVCWLSESPWSPGQRYLLKHGSGESRAHLIGPGRRLDLHGFERRPAQSLAMNDLASFGLALHRPLPLEPYAVDRAGGAFILVDEATNHTVAAGLVQEVISA
ncbi:MAG: 50S ribosome-binding GTPase [Acidobacteria bacterium]|nr:50S ribosome-binding GTPase [Acidobacteriota bacterium]